MQLLPTLKIHIYKDIEMLHIITFATDPARLKFLKDTSSNHIHYIMKPTWNGYFDKIIYTREYLSSINDNDIICFIDGYDVLSFSSEEEIVSKFKSYNCNIVLGAELNCFPERYKNAYPMPQIYTTNSLYVNSGGYIGYKHAIMKLLTWKNDDEIQSICSYFNCGDQAYFTEYYLSHVGGSIKLDTYQKIFQNMHWVSWNEFYIHKGRIINSVLNEKPCFMHFNGSAWQTKDKENILPIIVDKVKMSKTDTNIYTLHDYKQIITATCWPHKQVG